MAWGLRLSISYIPTDGSTLSPTSVSTGCHCLNFLSTAAWWASSRLIEYNKDTAVTSWNKPPKQTFQNNWSHDQKISAKNFASMYLFRHALRIFFPLYRTSQGWLFMSLKWLQSGHHQIHVKRFEWICMLSGSNSCPNPLVSWPSGKFYKKIKKKFL